MKRILFILIPLLFFISSGSLHASCNNFFPDPSLLEGLNEEQQDVLAEEVQNYADYLDNQNLSREQRNAKFKDFINKIKDGLKVYSFVRKNDKLQSLIKTFEDSTQVKVYVYSYVKGAFLNNIFYRLSEAFYDVVRPNGYVKLKYSFVKVTEDENPVYNIIPEIEADELVLARIGGNLSNTIFTASAEKYFPKDMQWEISTDAELDQATFASAEEALGMLTGLKYDAAFASQLKLFALDPNDILSDLVSTEFPGYKVLTIKVTFSKNIKIIKNGKEGVEDFYKAFFNDPYVSKFVTATASSIELYASNSYWQSGSSKEYLALNSADPNTIYNFKVTYGYIYKCLNLISPPGDMDKFKQDLSEFYSGAVSDYFKNMYEIFTEGKYNINEKVIFIDELLRVCDLRKEMGETKWKEIHDRFSNPNIVLISPASVGDYFNTLYYHHKNYLDTEKLLREILSCNIPGREYMQMTFLARMLGDYEIASLNAQHRVHILKIMSRGKMAEQSIYENEKGEEDIAIRIFRTCKGDHIKDVLAGLETPSSSENQTSIFIKLAKEMNDALGSDYYSEMMAEIKRMITDSPDFQEKLSAILTPETLENRIAKWGIERIVNRTVAENNLGAISFSDIRFDEATGEISFQPLMLEKREWWEDPEKCDRATNPLCKRIEYLWERTGERVKLKPLDLILFINYNDTDVFNDPSQKKPQEIQFVPAYYLWQYKTEQDLANAIKIASIAIDLALIANAPGEFIKACSVLRKAFAVFELSAAAGTLAVNTLPINNAAFIETVEACNIFMAAIGIKQLVKAGAKISLKDALIFAVKNTSDGIDIIKSRIKNFIEVVNKNQPALHSLGAADKNLMYLVDDLVTLKDDLAKKAKEMWGVEWGDVGKVVGNDLLIKNLDDFYNKIPAERLNGVIQAFEGTPVLKYADEDILLYRRWGGESEEIGIWFSPIEYDIINAKKYLSLPKDNTAENLTIFKIKKGTPFIEGTVASKANDLKYFGTYATGGGNQIYILFEDCNKLIKQ